MFASTKKFWLFTAALNGLIAVIMGAVAAHAVADPQMAAMAEKASLYQLIHAVVLLSLSNRPGKFIEWARRMFLIGIILFSGTLYIRVLTEWAPITNLAPTGGLSLMAGWLLLMLAASQEE